MAWSSLLIKMSRVSRLLPTQFSKASQGLSADLRKKKRVFPRMQKLYYDPHVRCLPGSLSPLSGRLLFLLVVAQLQTFSFYTQGLSGASRG